MITETPPEIAVYLTKRMIKELKRYHPTKPFHAARSCKSHTCVWHKRSK